MDKFPTSYLILFAATTVLAAFSVIAAALALSGWFGASSTILITAALNGFLAAIVIGALASIVRLLDEILTKLRE